MVSLKFYSSFKAIVCNLYNYPINIKMNQCQNYLCFILWIYYCNCHPIIKNKIKKMLYSFPVKIEKALFGQLLPDRGGGRWRVGREPLWGRTVSHQFAVKLSANTASIGRPDLAQEIHLHAHTPNGQQEAAGPHHVGLSIERLMS